MQRLTGYSIETLHDEEIGGLVSTLAHVRGPFLMRLCMEVQQALTASCSGYATISTDNDLAREAAVLEYDSESMIAFVQNNVQR